MLPGVTWREHLCVSKVVAVWLRVNRRSQCSWRSGWQTTNSAARHWRVRQICLQDRGFFFSLSLCRRPVITSIWGWDRARDVSPIPTTCRRLVWWEPGGSTRPVWYQPISRVRTRVESRVACQRSVVGGGGVCVGGWNPLTAWPIFQCFIFNSEATWPTLGWVQLTKRVGVWRFIATDYCPELWRALWLTVFSSLGLLHSRTRVAP